MAVQTAYLKGSQSNAYTLNRYSFGQTLLPTASTAVATATALVQFVSFTNTTGSAVVVTVTDNSTEVSGGVATLFTASVGAGATVVQDMKGVVASGGIKWLAAATGVHGQVIYDLVS
jgi:hypothetical protein